MTAGGGTSLTASSIRLFIAIPIPRFALIPRPRLKLTRWLGMVWRGCPERAKMAWATRLGDVLPCGPQSRDQSRDRRSTPRRHESHRWLLSDLVARTRLHTPRKRAS